MSTILEGLKENPNRYKILTPNGYENFSGIRKYKKDRVLHITLQNGAKTTVTEDHIFVLWNTKPIYAGVLKIGDCLLGLNNSLHYIRSIKLEEKDTDFYCVVNSGKDQVYYGDDLLSHNCEFLGSGATLINGRILKLMPIMPPKYSQNGLDVYKDPTRTKDEPRVYVIAVDTARGRQLDYSAFAVIDVTTSPYEVVAKYRSNTVPPILFADQIVPIALRYNNAFIIIEMDGPGFQVSDDLHHIHEYPNILYVATKGRSGQILATGFGHTGKNVQRGVKMSAPVRRTGCANLKTLIETNRLLIYDNDIKSELSTFELKGDKYQAAEGHHDDLVMTLVTFSWLTTQKHFRDMMEASVREDLEGQFSSQLEHDLTPYGWVESHQEAEEVVLTEKDIWKSAQSDIWDQYAEQELQRASIDMDRLKNLEKAGWITTP
jgi:hypothetical protein